jgi:ElaB/YqjD/DUF883 family membrane-anchored ribosome-binding protein
MTDPDPFLETAGAVDPAVDLPPPDPDAYTLADVDAVRATTPPSPREGSGEAGGAVKERVSGAASEASSAGQEVVSTAASQASNVMSEVQGQARSLMEQTQTELRSQADERAQRAAGGLRNLQDQVRALAEGRPEEAGQLRDYVHDAHRRLGSVADRLESGGAQGALEDVARFARQRPGTFLACAALAGFLAGRLVRGQAAVRRSEGDTPTTGLGSLPAGSRGFVGDLGRPDALGQPDAMGVRW